jgi:hypothetical protein
MEWSSLCVEGTLAASLLATVLIRKFVRDGLLASAARFAFMLQIDKTGIRAGTKP